MIRDALDAPLPAPELARRWQALAADETLADVPGKIELTEWGEIVMTPVGKTHGLMAMRIGERLRQSLGGHVMTEVGIATAIGVRAPDVAWCSDAFLRAHPEELPLSAAPELCVEIASPANALPKLRQKASAYVNAGAAEAWLVFPAAKRVEIYSGAGRTDTTGFAIDLDTLFQS